MRQVLLSVVVSPDGLCWLLALLAVGSVGFYPHIFKDDWRYSAADLLTRRQNVNEVNSYITQSTTDHL